MKKSICAAVAVAIWGFATPALAQQQVNYTVSFENAVHHEAQIQAVFQGVKTPVLEVRMSRSSPGRYALHEFAKNVYSVQAFDSQGKPLAISRPNLHQWNVSGHDGTVRMTYTLFADRPDGTYAGVDAHHAKLNAPATYLYANGFEQAPARVEFKTGDKTQWTAATQLKPEPNNKLVFTAPNFQYLMDSPTELANLQWRDWTIEDKGRTQQIRIAMHHQGTEQELEEYTTKAKKLVTQAHAVFGELPSFDFGTYTFLACYMPGTPGDGMEHRNSTSITSSRPLRTGMSGNLGTLAHEFFHAWNVERIRPKSLEPFNFADANMSGELWLAEGFTSYYTDLLMHRAGVISADEYLQAASDEVGYVLYAPGKNYFSPVEMSQQAPFVDASRSVDPVNRHNTYISYYTFGSAVGFGLDLTLRTRFQGLSLDDYMRLLWQRHGKPEKPYTLSDLELALADLTKDPAFAKDFFQRHVYGKELMPYESLAKNMGVVLRLARPGKAELAMEQLQFANDQATLMSGTHIGSPLYKAGLEREDILVAINGKKLKDQKTLNEVLAKYKPGQTVQVDVEQKGVKKQVAVTLMQDPKIELVSLEKTGQTLTPEMKARREAWLGSKTVQ
jgi:predicted metalloprotease with PDZ domain